MTYKDQAVINRAWCPICGMPRGRKCLMSNPRSMVKMHLERRVKAEQIKRDEDTGRRWHYYL